MISGIYNFGRIFSRLVTEFRISAVDGYGSVNEARFRT
jgi:hypothetical protein